jgi:long-chain acyl-CoA synthetase
MREPLIPDIVRLHGKWRGSAIAVVTPDETLSWRCFAQRVDRVANGLIAAGCGGGARIGVIMANDASMLEIMFGAMAAGAIVAPLNPTASDASLNAMLLDADISVIAATADQAHRISETRARLRLVDGDAPGWTAYRSWRDDQPDTLPRADLARDAVCNIIYSSGTTGQPKGIAHTHGGRLDWAHDLAHALRYTSSARLLVATGLYSNITWAGLLPTLLLGGAAIIRPSFNAGDVLRTMADAHITHTSLVPVQFQRLLDHPDFTGADWSSMQSMMCCGAPLPLHIKEALFGAFACGVTELYGTTEGLITTLAPEEAPGRMASVGRPLPGEDIRILADGDRAAAPGEPGEIIALSRFAMHGYWNNPTATAQTFWTDPEGRRWLRSGDIGRIDAEGYLYVTDRKKDMIISGGQNIYPADLESVLATHPEVLDCAVFGVPSAQWGETPLALVVLRRPDAIGAETLRDWANQRLGRQQRLSAVEFRDGLARNANGKLLKRELSAPYWEKAGAHRS